MPIVVTTWPLPSASGSTQLVAKQVLTEGRTSLSEEELEMVVVLRVNKKFMAYVKEKHPEIVKACAATMPLFNQLK